MTDFKKQVYYSSCFRILGLSKLSLTIFLCHSLQGNKIDLIWKKLTGSEGWKKGQAKSGRILIRLRQKQHQEIQYVNREDKWRWYDTVLCKMERRTTKFNKQRRKYDSEQARTKLWAVRQKGIWRQITFICEANEGRLRIRADCKR